jgi:SEC-C motif domain protein
MTDCPCGSKISMTDCCGRYIANVCVASTAEALMRSRYTAYTLADADYLQRTSNVGVFNAAAIRQWANQVNWLGLQVLNVSAGNPGDEVGEVTYIARYRENDQERVISEQAIFHKIKGEWRYVGSTSVPSSHILRKVGRNAPCLCGSGKKSKKCCENPDTQIEKQSEGLSVGTVHIS